MLRKLWALPAILLSGALMLISSGPPAAAAPSGQHRGSSVTAAPELGSSAPSIADAGDVLDLAVVAAAVTVKLGYAPPAAGGTVVGPLDRYLLEAGPAPADRVPADAAWTPTDPQRGPPAIRQ
ncbi:hypothetical protein E1262_23065 [Jiangella aurantiaca]|uniref:Uncharacterized protein n=1 Tax=Jiangella aurantiaca TaxID=2530373 RepID=A0A4R5A569_9ACTN|nr:hypothetical protein [Jiangella aurantiaca]TDD66106.1 hypothetical protein E1262_23065 [Jiangella aurantiaca]